MESEIPNLSETQAILPDVIEPSVVKTQAPTQSDLPSHIKSLNWRDAAELMNEVASGIPGVGPAIKKSIELWGGLGDYSPEERLQALQWKWLIEQVPSIIHKLDELLKALPPEQAPQSVDVAAIINATIKASKKTADSRKRKLLQNALTNAFDINQYQAGMTLRLIAILEDLEYGDVEVLSRIAKTEKDLPHLNLPEELKLSDTTRGFEKSCMEQAVKARRLNKGELFPYNSVLFHHLEIIERAGLVIIRSERLGVGGSDITKKSDSWNLYFDEDFDSHDLLGMERVALPEVTELGSKLLSFILVE